MHPQRAPCCVAAVTEYMLPLSILLCAPLAAAFSLGGCKGPMATAISLGGCNTRPLAAHSDRSAPPLMITKAEDLSLQQEALTKMLAKLDMSQLELQMDILKKQVEIAKLQEQAAQEFPMPSQPMLQMLPPPESIPEAAAEALQQARVDVPEVVADALVQTLPSTTLDATSMVIIPPKPVMEAVQQTATAASSAADLPWFAFAIPLVVFPTVVIAVSSIREGQSTPKAGAAADPGNPNAPTGARGSSLHSVGAYTIFTTGIRNLSKDPTGWFFGQASPLYSNQPPPTPPSPAASSRMEPDTVGKVTPVNTADDAAPVPAPTIETLP